MRAWRSRSFTGGASATEPVQVGDPARVASWKTPSTPSAVAWTSVSTYRSGRGQRQPRRRPWSSRERTSPARGAPARRDGSPGGTGAGGRSGRHAHIIGHTRPAGSEGRARPAARQPPNSQCQGSGREPVGSAHGRVEPAEQRRVGEHPRCAALCRRTRCRRRGPRRCPSRGCSCRAWPRSRDVRR